MIFYVYVYLDPRKHGSFDYGEFHFDFEPFYVGKGSRNQWSSHLKLAEIKIYKSYKLNKIRKIQSLGLETKIIKYKENLTEQEAFDLEKKLIKTIGRLNLGLGPLTNLTDGGEGSSGRICTKETRQKLAEKKIGNVPWNTGKTVETHPGLASMAEKNTGRTKENDPGRASQAEKIRGRTAKVHPGVARRAEKMRVIMAGSECAAKTHNLIFKNGLKQTIKNLAKFSRETGFKLGKDFKKESDMSKLIGRVEV